MKTATADDIPALVEMGRAFHEEKQDRYEFCPESCAAFFRGMIEGENTAVFMDRGFICGAVIPQPSNARYRIAYEMFFWAGGGTGRALLRAFEDWATDMGCREVVMSYPAGDRAARYFARMGYSPETEVVGKALACV